MYRSMFSVVMACLIAMSCGHKETPKVLVTTSEGCSIKKTSDYKKADHIGVFNKGEVAEVLDVYGDYIKVVAKVGTNSITGWTWIDLYTNVAGTKNYVCINKGGASILDKATKPYKAIGAVKYNETVSQIDVAVTWYKLLIKSRTNNNIGWAYTKYIEPIKSK